MNWYTGLWTTGMSLLGREPKLEEFSGALPLLETGGGAASAIPYWQALAAREKAEKESAAEKGAVADFLSGYAPFAKMADKNLSAETAAGVISLSQMTRSGEKELAKEPALYGANFALPAGVTLPGSRAPAGLST